MNTCGECVSITQWSECWPGKSVFGRWVRFPLENVFFDGLLFDRRKGKKITAFQISLSIRSEYLVFLSISHSFNLLWMQYQTWLRKPCQMSIRKSCQISNTKALPNFNRKALSNFQYESPAKFQYESPVKKSWQGFRISKAMKILRYELIHHLLLFSYFNINTLIETIHLIE